MPLTPTDPTKPQVWVTGTAPNQTLDFYIPQGPKGDPGGFTNNPVLATTDLDQILTPGTYSVSNAVDVPGSLARHLPFHEAGSLIVTASQEAANVIIQTYITNTKNMYIRRRFSGSWNSWRAYASTRVDQTAGRVIYTYDEVNAREQLIFGDTGVRNVTSDLLTANGYGVNQLQIRRVGNRVTVHVDGLYRPSGVANGAAMYVPPSGFGISSYDPHYYGIASYTSATGAPSNLIGFGFNSSNLISQQVAGNWASNLYYNGGFSYTTDQPWPTTLPGTALGTIPNT